MIHRFSSLLTATSGSRFCTIGATALFALTGLAISSPLVFLLVALVAVLGFFVYRSERELYLRAHKPSRPQDLAKLETKAFAEWLSFATAADVLLSSITDKTKLEAGAIWVLEYKYISLKNPNVSLNTPVDDGEQLRIALEIFQQHRKAFLSHGFYPLYVSKEPAGHIIATTGGTISTDQLSSRTRHLPSRSVTKHVNSRLFSHKIKTPMSRWIGLRRSCKIPSSPPAAASLT